MTLENLQLALKLNNEELIARLSMENADILKRFSIDKDGNVLFDGEKIISDIKISAESGNGIEQKEDGIYVPDESDIIKKLKEQINIFSEHQRYLNSELEWAMYVLKPQDSTSHGLTVKESVLLPFQKLEGNMDNANNGRIKLKGGKTYSITYGAAIMDVEDTYGVLLLKDMTNSISLQHMYVYPAKSTWATRSNEASKTRTYSPEKDCEIAIQYVDESSINEHNKGCVFAWSSQKTFIVVQEIGHVIEIDPVEHINDTQGIEDAPVGHILSYMGNTPPKHYLACDGSIYNIIDYPELSNHIRREFGSYDFWGGDGIDTFAVPDLRGEFLRGSGINSHEDNGNGADVGEHQDATRHPTILQSKGSSWSMMDVYDTLTQIINADKGVGETGYGRTISAKSTQSQTHMSNYFTSRPTNTSVMYCIKYEKTYFFEHKTVQEITGNLHEHSNQEVLDKLTENNGTLMFNGNQIEGGSKISVSPKAGNAIEELSTGIYVKDQSQTIKSLQNDTDANRQYLNLLAKNRKHVNSELKHFYGELSAVSNTYFQRTGQTEILTWQKDVSGDYQLSNDKRYVIIPPGESVNIDLNITFQTYVQQIDFFVYITCGSYSRHGYTTLNFDENKIDSLCMTHLFTNKTDQNANISVSVNIRNVIGSNADANVGFVSNLTSLHITETNRAITIDPVEYVNDQQGIEDTPVGHILSYMGNTAPKHYLKCDGAVYDILAYPMLANHIRDEFGSYDYFGGDGLKTFAVPDLRGEFLRGTGRNGADVGNHQDATAISSIVDAYNTPGGEKALTLAQDSENCKNGQYNDIYSNYDAVLPPPSGKRTMTKYSTDARWQDEVQDASRTVRPTNTAVLYCIKYEPTYYFSMIKTSEQEELELLREQNKLLRQEIEQLSNLIDKVNRTVV